MPHYHPTLAEIWSYPAEELAQATMARVYERWERVRVMEGRH